MAAQPTLRLSASNKVSDVVRPATAGAWDRRAWCTEPLRAPLLSWWMLPHAILRSRRCLLDAGCVEFHIARQELQLHNAGCWCGQYLGCLYSKQKDQQAVVFRGVKLSHHLGWFCACASIVINKNHPCASIPLWIQLGRDQLLIGVLVDLACR